MNHGADSAAHDVSPERSRGTILVVDDNDDLAEAMSYLLEELGYHPTTARDGASALARARELHPVAMLCDIDLPDMSGYMLARAVRAEPGLGGVRLIAVSGHTRPQERERAQAAGFELHLGKPVDADLLERALASAC